MNAESVASFDEVRKTYKNTVALDGLTVTIRQGAVTALLGPNGAGKTTMLEILTGIRRADSGTVEVLSMDPGRQRTELASSIGVQVQEFCLQPTVNLEEALRFFASLYTDPEDVDSLIRRFGLEGKRKARFPSLSGGQKRRVAIAKALVGNPELVILDEPTSGLDPQGQDFLRRETRNMVRSGRTVLLSTHDVGDAEELADEVVVIDSGRVVAQGSPADLIWQHCLGWRVECALEEGEEPLALSNVKSSVEEGFVVYFAENREVLRGVLEERRIISERRPTLRDAYFMLTGSALRI